MTKNQILTMLTISAAVLSTNTVFANENTIDVPDNIVYSVDNGDGTVSTTEPYQISDGAGIIVPNDPNLITTGGPHPYTGEFPIAVDDFDYVGGTHPYDGPFPAEDQYVSDDATTDPIDPSTPAPPTQTEPPATDVPAPSEPVEPPVTDVPAPSDPALPPATTQQEPPTTTPGEQVDPIQVEPPVTNIQTPSPAKPKVNKTAPVTNQATPAPIATNTDRVVTDTQGSQVNQDNTITLTKADSTTATLPNTGEKTTGFISLAGVMLLTIAGYFGRKKKKL